MEKEKVLIDQANKIVKDLADQGYSASTAIEVLREADGFIRRKRAALYEEAGKTALKDILKAEEDYLPASKSPSR